jgi:NAD(P)-dependent dehydrogenase (short-subunit alcohol dehydrogenase family)
MADPAVVITGASTGIGEACALHLDRLGFRVFAGVRRVEDGDRLAAWGSGRIVPLRLDVTDEASIRAAAETVERALGADVLGGLVNNAGIAVAGPLEYVPVEAVRRQLEVNVVGALAVIQAFLPLLRRGRGRLVNMSSVSGRFASPFLGPYAASKFALEALSDSLRVELRPWRIHVAIVEPGVIATPIWKKSLADAEEMLDGLPPEADERYGGAVEAIRGGVSRIRGIPADHVARVVAHALTARRPRTRYVLGRGARLRVGMSYLPTGVRDWIVARAIPGIHGPGRRRSIDRR